MAHHRDDDDEEVHNAGQNTSSRDLNKYELWRVIKEQVKILRDEMNATTTEPVSNTSTPLIVSNESSLNEINKLSIQGNPSFHSDPKDQYSSPRFMMRSP